MGECTANVPHSEGKTDPMADACPTCHAWRRRH